MSASSVRFLNLKAVLWPREAKVSYVEVMLRFVPYPQMAKATCPLFITSPTHVLCRFKNRRCFIKLVSWLLIKDFKLRF